MEDYKHGMYTGRKSAEITKPKIDQMNGVAVIGTAPINLASEPAVNKIVAAFKKADADAALGVSDDFENYTLLHSVYAQFNKFGVGPVVFINVLDPENNEHIEAVADKEIELTAKSGKIDEQGILLDKITVTGDSGTKYTEADDYVVSFADDGTVTLSATDNGKMASLNKVSVSYVKLKPSGVKAADIIGGVDENFVRTGLELLDEVYPRTGVVPSIIIAPGFSKDPSVAAALDAKAQLIYDLTNGATFTDLDSTENGANTIYKVKDFKNKNTVASRWTNPVWPLVHADGYKLWASSFAAAAYQYSAIQNGNVPSSSASNCEAYIDGICLEAGTELFLTEKQVNNYLNACGVTSFLKLPTWKLWGNNTAAFPVSTAPLNRFTKSVIMLNWLENKFKLEYLSTVDKNINRKIIKDLVNKFNLFLNSITPDHLAGGKIVFEDSENPDDEIALGHVKFHTYYADYTPAESIENVFEYDFKILSNALKGDE